MSDETDEQPESRPESRVVQMPRRSLAAAAPASLLIGAINIAVFALMVYQSPTNTLWSPSIATLLKWGANYGPLTAGGQPWRMLTSMFLHVGLVHIAVNMWSLYNVGPITERYFGAARFVLLYFIAGLGGAVVSMLWHPFVVSAGASGAIFGILGGMLAYITLLKHFQPSPQLGQIQLSIIKVIGLNVIFGMSVPNIDNGAHLGGLAFGTLTGLALAPLQGRNARVSTGARALLGITVMLALLVGTGWVAMQRINTNPKAIAERKQLEAGAAWQEFLNSVAPLIQTQEEQVNQLTQFKRNLQAHPSPAKMAELAKLASGLAERADQNAQALKALKLADPHFAPARDALVDRSAHIAAGARAVEKAAHDDPDATQTLDSELQAIQMAERNFMDQRDMQDSGSDEP